MSDFNQSINAHRKAASFLYPAILVGGLLIILYTTLKPFDFQFRRLTVGDYLARYEIPPSSAADFPLNILLFMPLGFGFGAILDQRGWSRNQVRLGVLFIGLLLTFAVESLQQFMPTRQPSFSDLVSNTMGTLAGLAFFRLWQKRVATADWLRNTLAMPQRVLAALAIYSLILSFIAYGLSSVLRYDDWNLDYRMILGNEQTGNRQWQGTISDLVIYNRALEDDKVRDLLKNPDLALRSNEEGLLGYYPLTGDSIAEDLTRMQPDLTWRPASRLEDNGRADKFDGRYWLETEAPVKEMSEQLQEASQTTIRLTLTTSNLAQIGPGRIVSISEDPFLRNLMLGQDSNDLVIRFRSWLTGKNGSSPQFLFPDFFTGPDPVDLVVTYDGLSLDLVDSRSASAQSVELVPGIAFYYRYIDPIVNPNPSQGQSVGGIIPSWTYRLLFYTVVLLPLGIFISLRAVMSWPGSYRVILIVSGLLLIPLLLESVLVFRSGQSLRVENIVTSILVIGVVAWLFVPMVRWLVNWMRTTNVQRGSGSG